jgi:hypothetical protein
VGDNAFGQCNVSSWSDIVQVAAGGKHIIGLKDDGSVVAVGDNTYSQCNLFDWKLILGSISTSTTTTSIISTTTVPGGTTTTTTIQGETTTTTTIITTTTTTIKGSCQITSVTPSLIRIGFGLWPRIKNITVALDQNLDELGITENDLVFDITKGIKMLKTTTEDNAITATVLFWGTSPGTYHVTVGECGSAPFVIKRF